MPDIYIVIAFFAMVNPDGTKKVLYDDESEKFISDEQVAEGYYDYLKQKNSNPEYNVVMQKLNIENSIDIQQLLYNDAISKLTTAEREVVQQKISE